MKPWRRRRTPSARAGIRQAEILAALNQAYAGGDYPAAMRRMAEFREARNLDWVAAQDFIRAGLFDRALDTLERLYETRDQNLVYISVAPIFDPLRSHPRFRALLQKMNLPSA